MLVLLLVVAALGQALVLPVGPVYPLPVATYMEYDPILKVLRIGGLGNMPYP